MKRDNIKSFHPYNILPSSVAASAVFIFDVRDNKTMCKRMNGMQFIYDKECLLSACMS